MAQKFANAARGELLSTINDSDATLEIVEGGSLFPVANTGAVAIGASADWFKLVLQDDAGIEIVFVRTHTSGSTTFSNILRGQEGTTAREFLAGSVVGLRPTAGDATGAATQDDLIALGVTKQTRTTVADAAPSSPHNGQEWMDGTTGINYTWTDDGVGAGQWVEFGPGGQGQPGADGAAGATSFSALTGKPTTLSGYGITDALGSTNPAITGSPVEDIFAITDGGSVSIDPANGSIQTWTLGASRTPTAAGGWLAGQGVTLMIDDGTAYTVTWTTIGVNWLTSDGNAPTLRTTGYTAIVLWKVGSTIYGK